MDKKNRYTCTQCKKSFSKESNLKRHNNTHLDKNSQKEFCCFHCEKKFNSKFNLSRHLLKCKSQSSRSLPQVTRKVKCAICSHEGSQLNVLKHYTEQHDIEISTECKKFDNFNDFEKWKDETEKTYISKYIRYDSKKSATATQFYYRCHRDGFYKRSGKNMRHLKIQGSNKINGFCPSKMNVTVSKENEEVSVHFVKTHVGHQMDLGKIPLGKSEKNILASKLSQKIPFDEIMNHIRDNVDEDKIERLDLLTRKDLFNIKQLYNLNSSVRHSNDCVSVQEWIKEMQENSCNSVIRFYKGQDEDDTIYQELQKDDFLLIIMNDAQMDVLKKYGKDCICIDSIHGLNKKSFALTTLMVLDDLRQGFPCFFAFTNRSDVVVFKIIFKVLKNVLADFSLTPSVFMSDMSEHFYDSWSDVMGPVESRLFCSWYVFKAWKDNVSSRIKNPDKQSSVHNILRTLLEELDQGAFEKMLDNFIHNMETDVDLKEFGRYFAANFYENKKSWAYCYRKHTGLDTNMHLERMHRTLKYIYLKGKTANRLDKAISAIMKLVKDKLHDRLVISHKGKVSTKLRELRKRHLNMEQIKDISITEEQEGNWILSSATAGQELYKIERANLSCKCELKCAKCDTCIHAYICSCPDSSVKWNMCKHIHLLCQSDLINSRANIDISDNNDLYIHYDVAVDDEETEIILNQLTSSEKLNNMCELDEHKEKLFQMFQSILNNATTTEKYCAIEKILTSLAATLVAMDSSSQFESNDV